MTRRTVVGMRVVNMMLMMGLVIKVVVNIKMDMQLDYMCLVRVMVTTTAFCPLEAFALHIVNCFTLYDIKVRGLWSRRAGSSSTRSTAFTNSILSSCKWEHYHLRWR